MKRVSQSLSSKIDLFAGQHYMHPYVEVRKLGGGGDKRPFAQTKPTASLWLP